MEGQAIRKARKVVPLPSLTARSGSISGHVFRLAAESGTLGRRRGNAYVVPDPSVSRLHAAIRREAGAYVVTDLGSSAGTSVNGQQLTGPCVLHHGDVISFGPVEFLFEDPSAMAQDDEMTMVLDIPEPPARPKLSPRQQQVLELMAEGLTNSEIGDQLGVTERTVKAYAQELYDKLGARNRAGAVAEAARLGIL